MFRYCIQDLLKHLHRDALQNIMFCFTNTRNTFYRPGESLSTLKQLLCNQQHINLQLNERNIYCMDNEAFKLLCALKQRVQISAAEMNQFERSWDSSAAETNRLLDNISELKPHNLQDTQSINDTRQSLLILIKSVGDISRKIEMDIAGVTGKKLDLNTLRETTAKATTERIKSTMRNLNKRLEDLETEKRITIETSAKLAFFLTNFAIVAYNDSMEEYLKKLIEIEQQKVAAGCNGKILAGLKDMKKKSSVEKLIMENLSLSRDSEGTIDLNKMDALINNLYSLPLTGSELKRFL